MNGNGSVLATGVTGFLGGALTARLVTSGSRVLAIVRATDAGHARTRRPIARALCRRVARRSSGALPVATRHDAC